MLFGHGKRKGFRFDSTDSSIFRSIRLQIHQSDSSCVVDAISNVCRASSFRSRPRNGHSAADSLQFIRFVSQVERQLEHHDGLRFDEVKRNSRRSDLSSSPSFQSSTRSTDEERAVQRTRTDRHSRVCRDVVLRNHQRGMVSEDRHSVVGPIYGRTRGKTSISLLSHNFHRHRNFSLAKDLSIFSCKFSSTCLC